MNIDDPKKCIDAKRFDTDERRTQIARAARQLIVEKGFEGLRTRDIAERVGINVATLHYHVPNKEALIELLAQSLSVDFMAQHVQSHRPDATPLERLREELADYRDSQVNNPELHLVMIELIEKARRDEKIAAVIRPMQRKWHRQIAAIVASGREDGTFRANVDPQAAATMVIGAMVVARHHSTEIDYFDRVTGELERSLVSTSNDPGHSPR